jgi:hypothetical protein
MSAEATLGALVLQWHKPVPYATALQRGDRHPQNAPIPDSLTEVIHDVGASKFFLCPKSKCASAPLATNHSTDLFKLSLTSKTLCLEIGPDNDRWKLLRHYSRSMESGLSRLPWRGRGGVPSCLFETVLS